MKFQILIFLGILVCIPSLSAQSELNQMDNDGKRHGKWQKTYNGSSQLRYQGQFNHGKEIGTFKFYCEECGKNPTAIKVFNDKDDISEVSYYTISGKLVSEGKMDRKDRIGEWIYYQEKSKSVMTSEYYKAGKLHGVKTTYYPHGEKAEEENYNMDIKEGENNYFSHDGVLLKKLIYVSDQLHGPAVYYDAAGSVTIDGQYKKGKKDGLWRYYKDGKLTKEETYPIIRKKKN